MTLKDGDPTKYEQKLVTFGEARSVIGLILCNECYEYWRDFKTYYGAIPQSFFAIGCGKQFTRFDGRVCTCGDYDRAN